MARIKCNLCEQGALKGSCLVSENIRNKTASYQYNILEPGVPCEANAKINSWAKLFEIVQIQWLRHLLERKHRCIRYAESRFDMTE